MDFYLPKLVWWLLDPEHLLVLLSAAALLLQATRWRGFGRGLALTVAAGIVAVSAVPVGSMLLYPLEHRFARPEPMPERVDGIIVLGGSFKMGLSEAWQEAQLNDSAERLTTFVGLARRYPDARLVFSGGSGAMVPGAWLETDAARNLFAQLGLEADRVLLDDVSRNTFESAANARQRLDVGPGGRWLLVTSAYHIPRAVGVFRAADWPVVAFPTDYRTSPTFPLRPSLGLSDNLDTLSKGVREWLALTFYWVQGRTSAWLPAPAGG